MTQNGAAEKIGNICGVLVHVAPGRENDVTAQLNATPGIEVHAAGGDGRLVVTVEDTPEITAAERLATISGWPGVMSAALVYHHYEPDSETAGSLAKEA
jgi:nitrate reductase NapD